MVKFEILIKYIDRQKTIGMSEEYKVSNVQEELN